MDAYLIWHSNYSKKTAMNMIIMKEVFFQIFYISKENSDTQRGSFPLRGKTKEVVAYENESESFGDCFLLSRGSSPVISLFNISTRS
jgi:hypothetical protein